MNTNAPDLPLSRHFRNLALPLNSAAFARLVLALLFGLASAQARSIYVSTTGNDATGDGSAARPYRTVGRAHTVAADGDAIVALAGTYNESLVLTRRVTFQSQGGTAWIGTVPCAVNAPPVVSISPTLTVQFPQPAALNGQVTDDGCPLIPGHFTAQWRKVSGPGTVTFGNPTSPATTATFSAPGVYGLELLANDGVLPAAAAVQVNVVGTPTSGCGNNHPPEISAGADQTISIQGAASLCAAVSDDGCPNSPGRVTVTWTKLSGPGSVTFSAPASACTSARFSVVGGYVLRASASDGSLTVSDDVAVMVDALPNRAPTANAGSDQTFTLPAVATLTGTVSDDGLPNPPSRLTVTWSKVSGPGAVSFGDARALITAATFSAPGLYTLRLTASDSALTGTNDVAVRANPATTPPQPPTVTAGPDVIVQIPDPAMLSGRVTDDGLPAVPGRVTSLWTKVSGPGTVQFQDAASPSTRASFSSVGSYVVRLTATDGQYERWDEAMVTVTDQPGCGVIEGTVTYAINGGFGFADFATVHAIRNGWIVRTTQANHNGRYEFRGLSAGIYSVSAAWGGYTGILLDCARFQSACETTPARGCNVLVSDRLVTAFGTLGDLNVFPFLYPAERTPEGLMTLEFTGTQEQSYAIEASSDLQHWAGWTNVVCTADSVRIVDPRPAQGSNRFYRVRLP